MDVDLRKKQEEEAEKGERISAHGRKTRGSV